MNKKLAIIGTAQRLFYNRGIRATKMIDIANELLISKKTLYQIFRSKELLVDEVYMSILEDINEKADRVVNGDLAFPEQLVEYILIIDNAVTYSSPRISDEIRKDYPALQAKVNDYVKNAVFNRFHMLLQKGKLDGMLGDNVSVETVIILYRDAIANYLTDQYNSNLPEGFSLDPNQSKNLFRENLITLFRGILSEQVQSDFNNRLRSQSSFNHIGVV